MFGRIAVGLSILWLTAVPVSAQSQDQSLTQTDSEAHEVKRAYLGNGRLLQNDFLGDGHDRWRTGSYAASVVRGYGWEGDLPSDFGDLLEYRFLAETIQPADIVTPAVGDRPYASALSLGVHSHSKTARGNEISFGGDLVIIGSQTGLDHIQNAVHDLLSMPRVSSATLDGQIGNKIRPSATFEIGRNLKVGEVGLFRPFVEARAGVETYARVGFDLTLGPVTQGDMLVRDPVTGQRYRTIRQSKTGPSFTLGADIAKVVDSTFLPEDQGYVLSDSRARVRAGVNWQGKTWSAFYGVTWLGTEFVGQPEGQLVGALNINFQF